MKQNNGVEYLNCDKEGHSYEQLNILCVDKNCNNQGLHCIQCFIEQNHNHQPESLVKYLQTFKENNILKQKDKIQNKENTLQMDQIHQKLKSQIYELEQHIQIILKDIQNQIQTYLDRFQEKYNKINEFGISFDTYIQKILQPNQDVGKTKQLVKQFLDLSLNTNLNNIDSMDQLIEANNQFNKDYHQKVQDIKEKITQLLVPLNEIDIDNYFTVKQFQLDQQLPKKNFQFQDNSVSRIEGSGYQDCFAILTPQLNSNAKITFKNVKGYWIAIGICFRNIIQKKKFQWMYSQQYHGTYLLSQNGYTWSHHDKQKNSQQNGFLFTENDTVEVNYDKQSKLLIFMNQKQNKRCQLEISANADDEIYFCVILHNQGDKASFQCN